MIVSKFVYNIIKNNHILYKKNIKNILYKKISNKTIIQHITSRKPPLEEAFIASTLMTLFFSSFKPLRTNYRSPLIESSYSLVVSLSSI